VLAGGVGWRSVGVSGEAGGSVDSWVKVARRSAVVGSVVVSVGWVRSPSRVVVVRGAVKSICVSRERVRRGRRG
jgi:hypothetical protein